MSGKYFKPRNGKKLPIIISLAVVVVLLLFCLVSCQAGGKASTTEPTTEPTTETTGTIGEETTEDTKPGEETTVAATEDTQPGTENTEPNHTHTYTEKVTAASCTTDGYTTYTCACGDSYKGSFTSATGHTYGEWVTTKEATKTATGTAQRKCSKCGATETKTLPKVIDGHTHSYTAKVTKEATCSANGIRTYTCSCGDIYTESISKTAHSYMDTVTKAACTTQGYATHTCKDCGYSYKDSYTPALGHSWGSWVTTKEPTEKAIGTAERTCSKCGARESKTLDKLASSHTHSYTSKVTTPATCGTTGVRTYTCSCGDTYTETIAKTNSHSWGNWVTTKEPTTTSTGYAERKCSVCGLTESKTLDKLTSSEHTHSWGAWKEIPATCTTNGYKYRACTTCGVEETAAGASALGHNHVVTSETPATCSANGSRVYTCSSCGDSYTETLTASHSWVHHHENEVGHWETLFVCHCGGWSGTNVESFGEHAMASEDPFSHSYYNKDSWVVDKPAVDYDVCSVCGTRK